MGYIEGLSTALIEIYRLNENSNVAILYDDSSENILEKFLKSIEIVNSQIPVEWINIDKYGRPLKKTPDELSSRLNKNGLTHLVNIFDADPNERSFRIDVMKYLSSKNGRAIHCPGINPNMFREGGPLDMNYNILGEKANRLIRVLEDFEEFLIVTGDGKYELKLNVGDRKWHTDLYVPEGGFGNLPAGEVYISPLETSANGEILVENRAGEHLIEEPIIVEWKDGSIVNIRGDNKKVVSTILKELDRERYGRVIGEFAIGINPNSSPFEDILESEKRGGHIARGPQKDMGSIYSCEDHQDFLIINSVIYGILHDDNIEIYNKGELSI